MFGMPPVSSKRPPPSVFVPAAGRWSGVPTKRGRELQILLKDLGYFAGKINGYVASTETRNAISLLQQRLIKDGHYEGRPNGAFDVATRQALLAHPDIPTTS